MIDWERLREVVEPGIWPLVEVLNLYGLETVESCEGHTPRVWRAPDGSRQIEHRPPYVSFHYPPPDLAPVIAHAVCCPRFPTHFDWHLYLVEWYGMPLIELSIHRNPSSQDDLNLIHEDVRILTRSFRFHLEAHRNGRFREVINKCIDAAI